MATRMGVPMIRDVKCVLRRGPPMVEDAVGVCALFLLLFAGLSMPGVF